MLGLLREYEYDRRKLYNQWIYKIYQFNKARRHICIVYFTNRQARAIQQVEFLEMDLSFKIVNSSTNVFSLYIQDTRQKRELFYTTNYTLLNYIGIVVFIYVFMNLETREVYYQMFYQLFSTLSEVSRKNILFSYINSKGKGIKAVIINICHKQALGRAYFEYRLYICIANASFRFQGLSL